MKALTPHISTLTNLKKNSTSFNTNVDSDVMITIAFPLLSYGAFPPCFCLNFTLLEGFRSYSALVQHFDIHIKHYAIQRWVCSFEKKTSYMRNSIRNLSSRGANAKKVTTKERNKKKAHLTPYTQVLTLNLLLLQHPKQTNCNSNHHPPPPSQVNLVDSYGNHPYTLH